MEQSALIEEIVARVAAKLKALETERAANPADNACAEPACPEETKLVGQTCRERQPGLLVLAQKHDEDCHAVLTSERLLEYFYTVCGFLQNYQVRLDTVEAVALFDLTLGAMVKIAEGHCDTPYTRLAAEALLQGKRVYVAREQVELYRYEATAPTAYYAMLEERLRFLEKSGVVICPAAELEERILSDYLAAAPECRRVECRPCVSAPAETAPCAVEKPLFPPEARHGGGTFTVNKRVITERDVRAAAAAKADCLKIGAKSIVTDLAREFAASKEIPITRE